MNWKKIKEKIYFEDGSLRAIYIYGTTKDDWQIWADFVNKNFETSFHIYETDITKSGVELGKIFQYWEGVHDNCSTATINIGNIKLNAHFFDDKEIENDITPKEINSIEDHARLISYLTGLSKALDKKVLLTSENTLEDILISVDGDLVILNLD